MSLSYDLVGKLKRNIIWGKKWLCLALFVLGSAYFIFKVYQIALELPYDFQNFWLAGEVWSQNASPYTSLFSELAQRYFESGSIPYFWFYPPNWYFLTVALAMFPFAVAAGIWLGLNCFFLTTTVIILVKALQKDQHRFDYISFFGIFGYLVLLQATPIAMAHGQSSILIGFGLGLVFFGVTRNNKPLVCLGLVILMLKPQIGLVFSLYLFLNREYSIAVLAAAAIVVAMMIPAFVAGGTVETVSGLLNNLSKYTSNKSNSPQNMTGLRNLIYLGFGKDIPPISMLAVALGFAGVLAWFSNTRKIIGHSETEKTITGLLFLTTSVLAVIPLHINDFVLLTPIVAFCIIRNHFNLLLMAGLALVFRANNLGGAMGFLYDPSNVTYPGNLITTIGALLILSNLLLYYKRLLR